MTVLARRMRTSTVLAAATGVLAVFVAREGLPATLDVDNAADQDGVTSKGIVNGSLLLKDFKRGQLESKFVTAEDLKAERAKLVAMKIQTKGFDAALKVLGTTTADLDSTQKLLTTNVDALTSNYKIVKTQLDGFDSSIKLLGTRADSGDAALKVLGGRADAADIVFKNQATRLDGIDSSYKLLSDSVAGLGSDFKYLKISFDDLDAAQKVLTTRADDSDSAYKLLDGRVASLESAGGSGVVGHSITVGDQSANVVTAGGLSVDAQKTADGTKITVTAAKAGQLVVAKDGSTVLIDGKPYSVIVPNGQAFQLSVQTLGAQVTTATISGSGLAAGVIAAIVIAA